MRCGFRPDRTEWAGEPRSAWNKSGMEGRVASSLRRAVYRIPRLTEPPAEIQLCGRRLSEWSVDGEGNQSRSGVCGNQLELARLSTPMSLRKTLHSRSDSSTHIGADGSSRQSEARDA